MRTLIAFLLLLSVGCAQHRKPVLPDAPGDSFEACVATVTPEVVYLPPGLSDRTPVCVIIADQEDNLSRHCISLGWLRHSATAHDYAVLDAN